MMSQIHMLGTLKGVALKSKVDNNNSTVHFLDLKFELLEGADKVMDIVEMIKRNTEITLDAKQQSLVDAINKPYKDDDKDEE